MDIQHIFLKRKQKISRLFLSIVAMLLIVCLLPTQVFAAEEEGDSLGVTRPNGGGNTVSNGYGKVVGDGTAWASMSSGKQSYLFMGYRVYMLDSTTKQIVTDSQVVDLIFDNASGSNFNKSNFTEWSTMYGNGSSSLSNRKLIKATNDINYITTVTSTDAMVVYNIAPNRSSTATAGNNFSTWMMIKDSSNVTNAQKVMVYAFGQANTQDYIKNTNYYLMVEPLFISSIWSYREWIPFEETYTAGDIYIEHFLWAPAKLSLSSSLIQKQGMVYDYCCDTRSSHVTPEEIKEKYGKELVLTPLSKASSHMFSTLIENSYDTLKKERIKSFLSVVTDKLNLRDSSWKTKTWSIVWNDLTIQEKNQVYNYCVANDIDMLYGVEYPKTVIKGYKLKPLTDISYGIDADGNKLYHFADYTVAYANKPDANWTRKHEAEGYHLVSTYTGKMLYGTYNNTINHCKDLRIGNYDSSNPKPLLGGLMGGDYPDVGNGFKTIKTEAGIPANTLGLHMYGMDVVNKGEPIHTKDPENPTPEKPHNPETPTEPKQNTGDAEIVKIYVDMYTDDSGKVHHIEDVGTFYKTGVTSSIIIEDEKYYKVTKWIESPTYNNSYKGTQWLSSTGEANGFDYSVRKQSTATTLLQGEDAGFTLDKDTNTLYVLYVKQMPYIETSDKPTPFTPDPTVPNPTKPENPSSDKNNQNNPDKKGSYNIIKVYTILDEYNGTPLKSETYTQSSTTPFIKIEQESNWTLAHWYTTNTHKPTVTGEDFFTKATDAQLKAFYENGYNLKPESTISSVIGTTIKSGTQPTTQYFTSGNTVYLLFTRTEGQAKYDATQQLITESYLAKRFSTLGYWDATGFHKSDLTLTVTTDSGIVEEAFRNHIFAVLNPSLPSGAWTDKSITFKVLAQASTTGNIISNYSKVHSALDDYKYSNITPYSMSKEREKLTEETMLFSNLEYRFTAYRQGDKVTLAQWKVDSSDTFSNKASRKESATGISNATSNYFSLANSKSTRTNSTELSSTTSLIFKAASNSDLTSATAGGSRKADIESIREIQVNMGVKTQVYAGKSTVNGTLAATDKNISGNNGDTAYSGRIMSSLVSGSNNKITFTPYIKMQYDSNNITNNIIYVTGRYGRTLTVNEYAGIYFKVPSNKTAIFKPNTTNKEDGKIQLSSNQWSTHASATAKVGENCVLPGGATLNIAVPEDARNTLHVETYYPILAGTGLNQVNSTGGSSSLPSSVTDIMKESHNKFVVSTISGLETLNVQQWVSGKLSANSISDDILTDRKTNKPVWSMSEATAPSYEGKDSKYYFRDDNDNDSDIGDVKSGDSNTGDLDVKQGNTVITYYTFYANANGDIYCKKHSDLGEASKITSETEGELVLAKGEDISKIRPNYLNINNKTGIVTNIVAALERNTGNDKNAPWASEDGHWYNEAFDGITYAVIDTSIEIGFINPYERTSVLDPELTPSNSGKNDFFTSYSYSQFKMKEYCELYKSTIGKIGKYRDYDICSDYLDEIMISDIFLIPNVNVQDLK